MKTPAPIRKFRKSTAAIYGVSETTVDQWAKDGLTHLDKLKTEKPELYKLLVRADLPAYVAGVTNYVMFHKIGRPTDA